MNKDGFFRVIIFLLQYYRIIFKLNPWVCSNILANLTFLECSKRFADNFKLLKVKKKKTKWLFLKNTKLMILTWMVSPNVLAVFTLVTKNK